jgi:hypothetical protein
MNTRCKVCAQPATKKCTGCGEVFCDLHVRYGGEAGGMYGSRGIPIGYYCDECWQKMTTRRRRFTGVLVAVGVVLLLTNTLGLLVFKGTIPLRTAPIAVGIVVLGLLAAVAAIMLKRQ